MLKRFITYLLILSMLLSLISINIVYAEPESETAAFELSFLKKLGIIPEKMKGEEIITRELAAGFIVALVYPNLIPSDLSNTENMFDDVEPSNEYFDSIAFLKRNGVVSGYNNSFYPKKALNSNELVSMLIKALGYTVYAEAYGGYPSGYYTAAKRSGILENVEYIIDGELTLSQASVYLFNALFSDVVFLKNVTDDGTNTFIDYGNELLSFAHGIDEYDAWVTDDGTTAINTVSDNEENKVVIENLKTGEKLSVFAGNTDIASYLGSRVRIFVKTDSATKRKEVVHFEIHRASKEIILNADKIANVTSGYIEYEEEKESGKFKKYSFGRTRPIVLINGIHKIKYQFSELKPDDGLIKLIDREGDGSFETVKVYNFNYTKKGTTYAKNTVVDKAASIGEMIYCRFNSLMNINTDDSKYIFKFVLTDGIRKISDIKDFDIISIAEAENKVDGKTLLNLVVSRSVVEGILTSVSGDSVFVDDNEYFLSSSITSQRNNYSATLAMGNKIKLYLDSTGKVAYTEGADSGIKNYGYILSYGVGNEFEAHVKIKFYTTKDEMIETTISDKALIDGKKYKTTGEQIAALDQRPPNLSKLSIEDTSKKRPFVYELNSDGVVIRIDTDTPNYPVNTSACNFYSTQTSIGYSDDEVYDSDAFKAGFRMPATGILRANTMQGKVKIDNTTTVINVPDIDTFGISDYTRVSMDNYYNYSETAKNNHWLYSNTPLNYELIKCHEGNVIDENYRVLTASMLSNSYMYDIQAYDINVDTGVAGLVVIRGNTTNYPEGGSPIDSKLNPMCVFLEINEYYDAVREKRVSKIYYTRDGITKEFALFDDDELKFEQKYLIYGSEASENPFGLPVEKLKKGDVIRVVKNGDWMFHIERVFIPDEIRTSQAVFMYPEQFRYRYSLGYDKNMVPGDVNRNGTSVNNAFRLQLIAVKEIKGKLFHSIVPSMMPTTGNTRSHATVQLDDPSTYALIMIDASNVGDICVIEKDETGGWKIRKGNISEITTVNEAGSIDNADILLIKQADYKASEIFLIKD